MDSIRLVIHGVPAPQGSKSAYVRDGRAVVVEGGSKSGRQSHVAWRQAVAQAARDYLEQHPMAALDEQVRLTIHFRFPSVKSAPFRIFHITKPDLSKLIRSTEDALVDGGLLADDRYVCSLSATKHYDFKGQGAGAEIEIERLGLAEEALSELAKDVAKRSRQTGR